MIQYLTGFEYVFSFKAVIFGKKKYFMILDRIENASLYYGLNERLKKGLEYIQNTDFDKVENGKYFLDSNNLFAIVSEYETKSIDKAKLESHKKYIDIQFIVEGKEQIGYVEYTNQNPTVAYDAEKDVMFFEEEVTLLPFSKGVFGIFYPSDLHQPCIQTEKVSKVRKVVVKVAV